MPKTPQTSKPNESTATESTIRTPEEISKDLEEYFTNNGTAIMTRTITHMRWNRPKGLHPGERREQGRDMLRGMISEGIGANLELDECTTVFKTSSPKAEAAQLRVSRFEDSFASKSDKKVAPAKHEILEQVIRESMENFPMYRLQKELKAQEESGALEKQSAEQAYELVINDIVYNSVRFEQLNTQIGRSRVREENISDGAYASWARRENAFRKEINSKLGKEKQMPLLEERPKKRLTYQEYYDQHNLASRTLTGEDAFDLPASGEMSAETSIPDALVNIEGTKEPVGFVEVKGYTEEELRQLVEFLEAQMAENDGQGPVRTIAENLTITKKGSEATMNKLGADLQAEDKFVQRIRELRLTEPQWFKEIKGLDGRTHKSLDIMDETVVVMRFLDDIPNDLIERYGKIIHKYGFRNVIMQKIPYTEEQVLEIGKQVIETNMGDPRKLDSLHVDDRDIKALAEVVNIDPAEPMAKLKAFRKKNTN